MFCPECRCEYREGFTRCGSCEVDLVPELDVLHPTEGSEPIATEIAGPLVDCGGFVRLEDARSARDRLRAAGLHAEIVIRDLNFGRPEKPLEEEYWIRAPQSAIPRVSAILDGEGGSAGDVACSECGEAVGHDESFCAHCGARFE